MPVAVKEIRGKYRVVEAATGHVATTKTGASVDGGGHESKEKAEAQARAINASLNEK